MVFSGPFKIFKMYWPMCNFNKIIIILCLLIEIINHCESSISSVITCRFYCHKDFISLEISTNSSNDHQRDLHQAVYWPNLQRMPKESYQPSYRKNAIGFKMNLKDFYKYGFIRLTNKLKNQVIYHQDLLIRQTQEKIEKVPIKCVYKIREKSSVKFKHKLMKRDELPEDFEEDDDIEILDTVQQQAALPQVSVEVRQNDELIDGLVNVIPGTPLMMEVKLNEESNTVYGLKVNYLQVSDTKDTSETILFRGCTVDPYLFENFNLTSTNSLKSKFRAFKFPNTLYVQFKINIEICLKRCPAPLCIASKLERLRQRRETNVIANHHYEVSVGLTMKILDAKEGQQQEDIRTLERHVKELKTKALLLKNDFK